MKFRIYNRTTGQLSARHFDSIREASAYAKAHGYTGNSYTIVNDKANSKFGIFGA